MALNPILFRLLRKSGGCQLGGRDGGVGPFRPWLKAWQPQITPEQFEALARRDYPGLTPKILFPLGGAGLNRGHQRISFSRRLPLPSPYLKIYGITKDSTGTPLASCTVDLFSTAAKRLIESTTSGADGYYEFRYASPSLNFFVVAYNSTGPVAGTTVNTLVGT